MFKDSLRMIMKIYLRIKFSLIPCWQFVCTKISRHPRSHLIFNDSFLDKDAKDSFNVTTNTVLFFIIGDLMPYSKVSGRFLILVIEGMSNGGSLTFLPTDRRTNFYSHAYHVQLCRSTSLISCRSARADFLHHLRFLTPSHAFLLFHPAHFLPSPANRSALVTITSRSSLLSFPLVVIAPDSYGISFPWPRKKVF